MMREAIKAVSRAAGGNDDHEDLRGVAIYGGEGPQHLLSELNFAATNRYIVAAYGPNLSVEDGITDWGELLAVVPITSLKAFLEAVPKYEPGVLTVDEGTQTLTINGSEPIAISTKIKYPPVFRLFPNEPTPKDATLTNIAVRGKVIKALASIVTSQKGAELNLRAIKRARPTMMGTIGNVQILVSVGRQ